ncbi:MAG: hypothetical protein RJA22_131 [Verrucomicrobiota bacterium]
MLNGFLLFPSPRRRLTRLPALAMTRAVKALKAAAALPHSMDPSNFTRTLSPMKLLLPLLCLLTLAPARPAEVEIKDLSLNGGLQDGKARLVIEAHLAGLNGERQKAIVASTLLHSVRVNRDKHEHTATATFRILQGDPREILLTLTGPGEVRQVTGPDLLDWSVRRETNGLRSLVLRPRRGDKPPTQFEVVIQAERELRGWANPVETLAFNPPDSALANGYVRLESTPELTLTPTNTTGLVPLDPAFLPEPWRATPPAGDPTPAAFRFHGTAYQLPLLVTLADPEAGRIVLRDFQLQGRLGTNSAAFTLTALARVRNPRGGTLNLLGGGLALSELDTNSAGRLRVEDGQFLLAFDQPGDYPVRLNFHAAVRQNAGWQSVDFRVAPSALQPISLAGLAADTQFEFSGAARPERAGTTFVSHLPPDGRVRLAWKEARAEAEGRLFYAANLLAQVSISPGLMRQTALVEARVMQGELSRLTLEVRGQGNVTAVQGPGVLSWNLEPGPTPDSRRLLVQFNQPQKESATVQVSMQTELGAFPQSIQAMQVRPEGATRVAGHLRVVNEGAVRLEVTQSPGLSQISPDQFPQSDLTKALPPATAGQRFAFRFASADFALRINADNILPEVGVSALLSYHLGETELAIDADLELDIREAPLRELLLRLPRGYAVARLNAAGLADYVLREPEGQPDAELRLVYSQPVTGRQLIQLRLERNGALGQAAWALPRIEVIKAKSTRGHVAASADPGFRLTPERTSGLTDIATAFYPRKVPNIQAAFRLAEPAWEATLRVERLPQSIQADVLHLFSIGEGIAYGSSTLNFFISGAPVSAFVVALSDEYFNVEFTGKDLRSNWQKTTNGYLVSLNAPVSGPYTLLVTYERPFKAQGDTLAFTGARPVDAQTEQGHTLVVSAYQFEVTPAAVSPGLLELQTAEVPSEYRLFFDAPILKAYRYTTRPFNLQLALRPLEQGATLGLVVDRAAFRTRVSKDGEVVTDAKYYVKNRGNPHFRLTLPAGTTLWSATVNGNTAVPVLDGAVHLIPLPQRTDPNAVQELDFKLAARSPTAARVTAAAPVVAAPVLLAEWQVEPDTGQVLAYRGGSLTPADGLVDASGFAGLVRLAQRGNLTLGLVAIALAGFAAWAWRWATRAGTHRFSVRHLGGTVIGLGAFALAALLLSGTLMSAAMDRPDVPRSLTFRAPVQQAGSALSLDLGNHRDQWTAGRVAALAWPALLGLVAWAYAALRTPGLRRTLAASAGWTLLAWATLRWPHGAVLFLGLLGAFLVLHLLLPSALALFRLPPRTAPPTGPATPPVTATLLLLLLLALAPGAAQAAPSPTLRPKPAPIADSVTQEVRVENHFVFATARIRWLAQKDQLLPLLGEPAVVTAADYPTAALKLVQSVGGGKRQHQLLALADGPQEITLRYQLHVTQKDGTHGFALPVQPGLVNRLRLTLTGMDADLLCAAAVAVTRMEPAAADTNATFDVVLAPAPDAWLGWKPRARDVRRERAVFFAEWNQLYVPAAGVLEGAHLLQVRPAQGELGELTLDVPSGATITDVTEAVAMAPAGAQAAENRMARPSVVSLWRFDPDTRRLRVTLTPAQSRPFAVLIRSQMPTGPLPLEQSAGLLSVQQAAGQVGAVGLATGDEVQLESATPTDLSPINLEDFPGGTVDALRAQVPGLTLRRAFRYTETRGRVSLKASAVEPDVRVETEQTLSLGEDRTVLAANVNVNITRAGVFRLSFLLATNLDVESLTGQALSHWTELRAPEGRIITLHLKGRTEGAQSFQLTLAGPGTRLLTNYIVPRLSFREAGKQRGQITLVPEQGLRLQVMAREGVTQLDPQKAGLRQKGLLAFRLLQADWSLTLGVEHVDAWVQVTSLQHLGVSEAMVKVMANLQYQIENTGLKALRVRVPTNAENVRFRGDQVADFLPVPGSATNGLQSWEIKLHRRVIGRHLLQAHWQTPLAAGATNTLAQGILAEDANLQRGFVTMQSSGRLQVRVDAPPASLQPAEWQSIPRALLQEIPGPTASHTFRLVEPAFQLPLTLERHGASRLLDARVQDATLTSVISDEGVMLTQLKLNLIPGDKRLLRFSLPPEASFWFAFVNQNGVWPWREQARLLIPLEQQSRADQPVTVELFYSSRIGTPGSRRLDLALLGPKLDLPLENITWQVYLNEKWDLSKWTGTLQLEEQSTIVPMSSSIGVQGYLQNELVQNQAKTKVAEEMLSLGNRLLEQGNPQQARRAFQSAYGLSTHDQAFNEDARVQLQNLKLQQAVIGLNVRQSAAGGETAPAPDNVRQLRSRKDNAYTQQEAKQIMEANDASDNAALLRLAERLVQQQDAAVTAPAAIRAAVPEQGRLLTFRRTVQVDTDADLRLQLAATARQAASPLLRLTLLAAVFALLALLAWFSRRPQHKGSTP